MGKCVLITGADGRIGGSLIKWLLETTEYDILGIGISYDLFKTMLIRQGIKESYRLSYLTNQAFLDIPSSEIDIYAAVHLAFSRRKCPAVDIASSLDFASAIFGKLVQTNVNRIINLSSQGVYGMTEAIRKESMPPAPDNAYTMAKYAAEVIYSTHLERSAVPNWTNLRLDPVVQSQNLVVALCEQVKGGCLQLRGGEQFFSFIDLSDAVTAIAAMIDSDEGWERIYNVGWNRCRYTLVEVAKSVADVAEKLGYSRPTIELDKQDIRLWAGMDSTKFMEKTNWRPRVDLLMMIENVLQNQ